MVTNPFSNTHFRLYVDTSVIGGCLDEEFSKYSVNLFDRAEHGQVRIVISDLILEEIRGAPQGVINILNSVPDSSLEMLSESREVIDLRQAYLKARVVPPHSKNDATHCVSAGGYF